MTSANMNREAIIRSSSCVKRKMYVFIAWDDECYIDQ